MFQTIVPTLFFKDQGDELALFFKEDYSLPLSESGSLLPSARGRHKYLTTPNDTLDLNYSGRWIRLIEIDQISYQDGALLCEALGLFYPFMPGWCYAIPLPTFLTKDILLKEIHNITIFGGTFNPWHEGHSACLDSVFESLTMVVPDANPFKEIREVPLSPFLELKRLSQMLKCPNHFIFPGFLGLAQLNPTVRWLPSLTPKMSVSFLMGDDNFLTLQKWTEYQTLLRVLTKVIVVPRLYSKQQLIHQKNILQDEIRGLVVEIKKEHNYMHLSSTEIRRRALKS